MPAMHGCPVCPPAPAPLAGPVRYGTLRFSVHDNGRPVSGASYSLYQDTARQHAPTDEADSHVETKASGVDGRGEFSKHPAATYRLISHHALEPMKTAVLVTIETDCVNDICVDLGLHAKVTHRLLNSDCTPNPCAEPKTGDVLALHVEYIGSGAVPGSVRVPASASGSGSARYPLDIQPPPLAREFPDLPDTWGWTVPSAGLHELKFGLSAPYFTAPGAPLEAFPAKLGISTLVESRNPTPQPVAGNLGVALLRSATEPTPDLAFWQGLLNSTEQLSFNTYQRFMDTLFCGDVDISDLPGFERDRFDKKRDSFETLRRRRRLPFTDADAYRVVKAATEAFVMVNCGVLREPRPFDDSGRDEAYLRRRDLPVPEFGVESAFANEYLVPVLGSTERTLPYLAVIRNKLPDIAIKLHSLDEDVESVGQCTGILQEKLANPCLLELIWSYWHEEGMLVQTMNSITRRFQNVRSRERDPLANLEIDPLRPLNNVLWGFVQDEQHRLSIVRRNYEYDHHYGLRLEGKAVRRMQAADSRSRFLEAFHNLLRLCTTFYRQDDDTTVKADAFPVLNALKEVHLILSQGAHNQFGDLPSTARIEMLMQQWLLARPEFREFLPTRIMTAYPEAWMDRVDAMKKVQGWTDTSVLHFRNLAVFGEQILLSVRWGHWSDVQDPLQAFNWARFFRPQIQGYSHAYRSVTGVELALDAPDARIDATLPSVLLQRRLATQQRIA
ncbi:MAG: hypothetical protein EOP82_26480 [Variovorax sp.]|nr:MAG: hypothetical protein EOP82_26480 [Variovorax sp.]